MNKKVLVTGASGYLGRHLIAKLEVLGWDYRISNTKTANLLDVKNLDVYNDEQFDYIFHLAAHTKAGDYCLYHKGEQFEINQLINTNMLKYWKEHQPQAKMIAMGTSCSYSPNLLMSEDNYLLGEPDEGLYTYAMTKRMLLVGLKSYADQYNLKWMYYIPSTLYGPNFDISDSHFIFDLIKKIYAAKKYGSLVELWGTGHQKRELIYVDDAIDIIINTLQLDNQLVNLGTGIEYSIREYAQQICDIVEYDSSAIQYDTTKYTGVLSKRLDTQKLISILPYNKFTPLSKGLNEAISYYSKIK